MTIGNDQLEVFSSGTEAWEPSCRPPACLASSASRLVLGDLGPSGHLLEPVGPITLRDLRDDTMARCRALLDEGVDGIICETLTAVSVGGSCGIGPDYIRALGTFVDSGRWCVGAARQAHPGR